jgi:hypothetical protein
LFNKSNNTITFASADFDVILTDSAELDWLNTYTTFGMTNYILSTTNSTSFNRIMGFGKALTDSQMTNYMNLLNTYIEETANIYI